jgi:hypothetical protein
MKTICPFPCAPAAPPYSCPCDWGHVLLGFVAACLPVGYRMTTAALFVGYEAARAKPNFKKLESLGQFAGGFVTGHAVVSLNK